MKQMHEMIKVSGKFHDKMKSFCKFLVDNFGISHFYHAKVTNSGHFTGVNLNRDWEEYFLSDPSHLLIWPDKCQPYKIKEGIRLLQENDNISLNQLFKKAREKYSINFSLQIVEKSNHGSDMFGFALNSADPIQHMTLIKEMPLLRLFIKRFQEEFKGLYAAMDENKVDIKALLGTSFLKIKNPEINQLATRGNFLKSMGIEVPLPLTNRETQVIKYLSIGCPASEIASALFISKRTVEHHIERIKDKFQVSSKSELVHKVRELELVGYFAFS